MNEGLVFALTLVLQWLAGLGALALFGVDTKRSVLLPAALLLGMYLHTVGVFVFELMHIELTRGTVLSGAAAMAVLLNCWWPRVQPLYRGLVSRPRWTLRMYDVAALLVSLGPLYIALWATWYWPVTPFDAMAGIDLVARQSLIEGHINNQIFTHPSLHGFLSNQPYYAPYAMLMQVVYRSMGFTFGQVWLAVQCIAFAWMMFGMLRSYVHPFIASILWLLLVMTPEWYGYQFLLQTDMANAIFFVAAAWFFAEWVRSGKNANALACAAFFAAAAWSRTESIVLIGFVVLASLPLSMRAVGKKSAVWHSALIMLAAIVSFGLWHWLYYHAYLPTAPNTASEIAGFDVARSFAIAGEFLGGMITNTWLWGLTVILFVLSLVISVVVTRRLGNPLLLIWISCILVALVLVGTVFTSALVDTTLRRGIFKVLPLMVLAIAQLPLVQRWGEQLGKWELARSK